MHIYSDISCFVQYIVMIITMSLRFRENMRMSLPKVCCKYATSVLLAAWKTKRLFKFWMENIQQRKHAKCASLKSCYSFHFVVISNSAIINESVNTAQLISYLHHLYTVFIIIRGLASRASRTLDWTRTLVFWAVSGFWFTKAPLIGHCVLQKSTDTSLICYNVQRSRNWAQTQIHVWFWPEAAAGYFRFVVCVYLVASFLSLELGYIHTLSLNHPGDPFFQSPQGLKATDLEQGYAKSQIFTEHCSFSHQSCGLGESHTLRSRETSVAESCKKDKTRPMHAL